MQQRKNFNWSTNSKAIELRKDIESKIGNAKFIKIKNKAPMLCPTASKIDIKMKRYSIMNNLDLC